MLVASPFDAYERWSVANAMERNGHIIAHADSVHAIQANPNGRGGTNDAIRRARASGKPLTIYNALGERTG